MLKHELPNFLSGTGKTKQEDFIQTIACYLAASKGAGKETEISKLSKQEEAKLIINYITLHHHWNNNWFTYLRKTTRPSVAPSKPAQ